MRVRELAKELGLPNAAVLAAAAARTAADPSALADVDHANDALTADEEAALRAALVPADVPADDVPDTAPEPPVSPPAVAFYRLARRASVATQDTQGGAVTAQRGDVLTADLWAGLPDWLQAAFDAEPPD